MNTALTTTTLPETAMTVTRPLAEKPTAVYLAKLAPGSRRTLRAAIDPIADLLTAGNSTAETIAWGELRYQHTAALRSYLAEQYASAMANKALAALRGVLKEAWRLGQMSAEDCHRAADLKLIRGQTVPKGRGPSAGELRALFAACAADPTTTGRRDAALLAQRPAEAIAR